MMSYHYLTFKDLFGHVIGKSTIDNNVTGFETGFDPLCTFPPEESDPWIVKFRMEFDIPEENDPRQFQ